MPLSVLSLLARLDFDPWQEAAKLALLPAQAATQRVAALIATLPDRPSGHVKSGMIAARLIALLPHEAHSIDRPCDTPLSAAAARNSQALIYAILMILMVGTQLIVASHQSSAPVDTASTHASSPISAQSRPPSGPLTLKSPDPASVDQRLQQHEL